MEASQPAPKVHHRWRTAGIIVLILIVLGIVARAILPWAVRDYVNRTLDQNPLYSGTIGDVQIHLWRGAYSIHEVKISKTTGNIPVPFFAAKRVDFSVEWKNLIHGKIVGRVVMEQPQLNFVDEPEQGESQTGEQGPWLQMLNDLFPFRINSAIVTGASVHFRTFQSQTPVDVYVSQLNGSIDDLTNIRDQINPLLTKVQASGLVMDQAKFEYKMALDPFSYRPTFHMALRLLGLDVTKLNDLAMTYGKFNFKHGWFDLVVETDCKEGQLTGYVKPLFRELHVFSLKADIKEDNVIQLFWQALVGAATAVLKNQYRNQFGTLVPFSGEASGANQTDLLATIGNVLRNAFVRAYLPRLESDQNTVEGMHFEPPETSSPVSPSETE